MGGCEGTSLGDFWKHIFYFHLFVCVGSYLQHVGSWLHQAGSLKAQ